MPLTPKELLIPRVLAFGTEPGTPNNPSNGSYISGDIYTKTDEEFVWNSKLIGRVFFEHKWVEMFPHLFRPIEWWEMMEPEQMPLYLKHGENGKVLKVKEYSTGERLTIAVFEGGLIRRLNKEWIPCDEAEYLEYQKSKK